MPKARVATVKSDDGKVKVTTFPVGQPDGSSKDAEYSFPSTFAGLQEMFLNASDKVEDGHKFAVALLGSERTDQNEAPSVFLYRIVEDAVRSIARNMVYEQAAAESTNVTISGQKYDIMELPLDDLVGAINGYSAQRNIRLRMAKLDETNPAHAEQVAG